MKYVVKIKIGKETTIISYTKKYFKSRLEAINTAISVLQEIIEQGLYHDS